MTSADAARAGVDRPGDRERAPLPAAAAPGQAAASSTQSDAPAGPADAPAGPVGAPAGPGDAPPPRARWALLPCVAVAVGGFACFALEQRPAGWAVLALALAGAALVGRSLLRDLSLVVLGLVVMSLVPVNTEVTNEHFLTMGTAMVVAVAGPYLVSRFVYRDRAVAFPLRTGERWTRFERVWLVVVVGLGYLLLPVYLIRSGVYENWPAVSDAEGVGRLFLGTNALGIWDELFFICTCFALLRRHLPDWQANLLQAVLFTSFLWELGFQSVGPLFIYPFALVQGWTFKVTKSLTYIVCVHLLFDLVLFGVLLHAHNRQWVDVFLY